MNVASIYERNVDLIPHRLPVVTWPNPILETECENISRFDTPTEHYLEQLSFDMIHTMQAERGLGLAAPQIGISANVLVMVADEKLEKAITLINPRIAFVADQLFKWKEGCLSVPGYFENRERPQIVDTTYEDIQGETHQIRFTNLLAFIVQHEIDHLQGKVFVDDLSPFKKDRVKTKIRKAISKRRVDFSSWV